MKKFISTLAAVAVLSGSAFVPVTHAAKPTAAKTGAKKAAPLVCPVTGMKIASVKAAAGKSTFNGKTYHFCCAICKPKFDKNPKKYVENAAKGKYEKM